MKAATAAVSLAARRVTVATAGFLPPVGDHPKFRMSHCPRGNTAGSMPGMSFTLCRSIARRVSVWQLTESVLKNWLFVGSEMMSRICLVRSGVGGVAAKSSAVATPLRLAMGMLVADTEAFLQVMGLRLLVCGSGTTRGIVAAGCSNSANC